MYFETVRGDSTTCTASLSPYWKIDRVNLRSSTEYLENNGLQSSLFLLLNFQTEIFRPDPSRGTITRLGSSANDVSLWELETENIKWDVVNLDQEYRLSRYY